jgi:hypothetical protein
LAHANSVRMPPGQGKPRFLPRFPYNLRRKCELAGDYNF